MATFITTGVYTTKDIVSDVGRLAIKATSPSGRSLTVEWNDTLDYSENHADAAAQLFCLIAECSPDVVSLAGGAIHSRVVDMAWSVMPRSGLPCLDIV